VVAMQRASRIWAGAMGALYAPGLPGAGERQASRASRIFDAGFGKPATIARVESPEKELRARLGVPGDAERVLVFTESSHWDPDWMLTSKGYYRLRVRRQLDTAIRYLIEEPRRVYCAECAFYLRMHWEARPELRDSMRDLLNAGRLRLMGSGVTTPDTVLPPPESILRDYLLGQQWYLSNGIEVQPEVAYFPDSFGHSAALPTLMRAVGVKAVAICRVDGMFFVGCENELPSAFPRPGTSAELLSRKERTQDFIWRSPDGTEMLAHWVAYGYGHGELLAHVGITRVGGAPLAVPARSDRHVARRVARYVEQLSAHARTPYMLCPIGFDFSDPIAGLVDLLDRYNERHYPDSGVWVVNAGLDDYFSLVECHRDELPVVELDPNPYFSGFYTSRPTLKRACRDLFDSLMCTEAAAVRSADPKTIESVGSDLADPWWTAVVSNHHDFVTGTSPDRVVRREQMPWIEQASRAVARRVPAEQSGNSGAQSARRQEARVTRSGSVVEVAVPWGRVVFDEELGGCVSAVVDREERSLLGPGPAFDCISYLDWGGLWRMGYELALCRFEARQRTSAVPARLDVENYGSVSLISRGIVEGFTMERTVTVHPHPVAGAHISIRLTYTVPDDRTVTVSVPVASTDGRLVTEMPGGVVSRSWRNYHDPTFWPVQGFAHFPSGRSTAEPEGEGDGAAGGDFREGGVAVVLAMPGAVALHGPGSRGANAAGSPFVEVVAMRNAVRERSLGVIPMLGFPARGHDPGPHVFEMGLRFTEKDWREEGLVWHARDFQRMVRPRPLWPDEVVTVDAPEVAVLATKPAERGDGVIVRLWSWAERPCPVLVTWPGASISSASLCDARERDLAPIPLGGSGQNSVSLEVSPGISSLRLVLAS
jgi:hypothetical protein